MSVPIEKIESNLREYLDNVFENRSSLKLVCKILYDFRFDKANPIKTPTLLDISKKYKKIKISLISKRDDAETIKKRSQTINDLDIMSIDRYLYDARIALEKAHEKCIKNGGQNFVVLIKGDRGLDISRLGDGDRDELKQFEIVLLDIESGKEIIPSNVMSVENTKDGIQTKFYQAAKVGVNAFIDILKTFVSMHWSGFKLWLFVFFKPKKFFADDLALLNYSKIKDYFAYIILVYLIFITISKKHVITTFCYGFIPLGFVVLLATTLISHPIIRYILRGMGNLKTLLLYLLIIILATSPLRIISQSALSHIHQEIKWNYINKKNYSEKTIMPEELRYISCVISNGPFDCAENKDMQFAITDIQIITIAMIVILNIALSLYLLFLLFLGFKNIYKVGSFRAFGGLIITIISIFVINSIITGYIMLRLFEVVD